MAREHAMSRFIDEVRYGEDPPHAFMQWKGTDACFDFFCTCGENCHFDGYFAYVVECSCGLRWEMPHLITPRPFDTSKFPEHNQPNIQKLDCE